MLRFAFPPLPQPNVAGKTYSALEALRKAKSGIYCGPLRLLAHEVYERLNGLSVDGVPVDADASKPGGVCVCVLCVFERACVHE